MTYRYRKKDTINAGDKLAEMSDIFKSRADAYGESYIAVGKVMSCLFPEGVRLETEDDFRRFHLFEWAVGKLVRYTSNWSAGGHADSIDDMAVYGAMLSIEDQLISERKDQ